MFGRDRADVNWDIDTSGSHIFTEVDVGTIEQNKRDSETSLASHIPERIFNLDEFFVQRRDG